MNSLNGGYAMIKYNSTQEELQIAYRSKKPVLCYDENRRAHWAVIEETATESVDEETQEPITIYEYSYRLIDEESGGKLYKHLITVSNNGKITIYNNSAEPFTTVSLATYSWTNGPLQVVGNYKHTIGYPAYYYSYKGSSDSGEIISFIYEANAEKFYPYLQNGRLSVTTDTVTQIL